MKTFHIVMFVCFGVLIVSCDKNTGTNPTTPTTTCMIQKVVYADLASETYTYDASGRVTKLVRKQDVMVSESNFTYAGRTVAMSTGGVVMTTHYLNSRGLADSSVSSIPGVIEIKSTFVYNVSGQVVSARTTGMQFGNPIPTTSGTLEYTGGNLTKEVSMSDTDTTTTTYEYYLDKVDLAKKSYEAVYFINRSQNLVKKETNSDGSTASYTYEFDSAGKVTKSTRVRTGSNAGTYVNDFTWLCP
ncbi:MAG: hypothetical protein H7X70_04175 [Candidatus Kapabacteria bacterium]|nr:hypothetical protein [Candidatus Kapabacteria bacterium]